MALREFTDEIGREWLVWSTYPSLKGEEDRVRSSLASGWLTFTSGRQRRRLVPVPPDWGDATDDRLREWLRDSHDAPPNQRLP